MVVALVYVAAALVGPRFAPYPYDQQDLLNANLPPLSSGHLFGTDQVGRDMLSRLLMGIRISLMVGVGVTAISVVIGGLAGAVAGDRKSTRLNSSHSSISYAVFCLKKKKKTQMMVR